MTDRWQHFFEFAALGLRTGTFGTYFRVFALVCLFLVILQSVIMWGTRWGDRNSMAKSFFLSVLFHACLVLEWTSLSTPRTIKIASATPPPPEKIQLVMESAIAPSATGGPRAFSGLAGGSEATPIRQRDRVAPLPEGLSLPEPQPNPEMPSALIDPADFGQDADPVSAPSQVEMAGTTGPLSDSPAAFDSLELSGVSDKFSTDERPQINTPPRARTRISRASDSPAAPAKSAKPNRDVTSDISPDEFALDLKNSTEPDLSPGLDADRKADVPVPLRPTQIDRPSPVKRPRSSPVRVVHGLAIDAETGLPLVGVTVTFDRANDRPLTAVTGSNGAYEFAVTETPDNFAVTATLKGYLPNSRNMRAADLQSKSPKLDFKMQIATESVIALEEDPKVHHLGNDRFEGPANSQFQRKSEGASLALKFQVTREQIRSQPRRATMTLLAKGVQCAAKVRVNGMLLAEEIEESPTDGSFGPVTLSFDPRLLREGVNSIELRANTCQSDLDDFEFVNVQIKLTRKE